MHNIESMKENLKELDAELIEKLRRRMELSGELNAAAGAEEPPSVRRREAMRAALEAGGEELGDGLQSVYRAIFAAERSLQNTVSGAPCEAVSQLEEAIRVSPEVFPASATVACQGVEGAYSQIACDRLFKSPAIMYFQTFEHVFRAVEAGLCSFGVLPIENSTAGSVNAIYDLMASHNFSIVRSARLRVSHCLLAKPGTKLEDIKTVYSHEQALSQCAGYIASLKGVTAEAAENTAVAAKNVAQSERNDVAAIASCACGENYGLCTLAEEIQDNAGNYTRFICISKEPQVYPGADRISLMMVVPHRPGALYEVISSYNALGINMRKIESRPLPGRDFEFVFYFDVEVSAHAPQARRLLRDLDALGDNLRYLGAYAEILC